MKKITKFLAVLSAAAICVASVGMTASTTTSAAGNVPGKGGTITAETVNVTMQELQANDYHVEIAITADVEAYTFGVGLIMPEGVTYVENLNDAFPVTNEDDFLWISGYFLNGKAAGKALQTVVLDLQIDENAQAGDSYPLELTTKNMRGESMATLNELTPLTIDGAINIVEGEYLKGDVDLDGKVTAIDAMLILVEYSTLQVGRASTFSSLQTMLGDVDENGVINAIDAYNVLVYYATTQVRADVTWDEILGKK